MTLSGKDKRQLRAQGSRLKDKATIGKAGLTDELITHINHLLDNESLIKIRLTEERGADRKAAAALIAEAVNAEVAGVVGRTVLLYRE